MRWTKIPALEGQETENEQIDTWQVSARWEKIKRVKGQGKSKEWRVCDIRAA